MKSHFSCLYYNISQSNLLNFAIYVFNLQSSRSRARERAEAIKSDFENIMTNFDQFCSTFLFELLPFCSWCFQITVFSQQSSWEGWSEKIWFWKCCDQLWPFCLTFHPVSVKSTLKLSPFSLSIYPFIRTKLHRGLCNENDIEFLFLVGCIFLQICLKLPALLVLQSYERRMTNNISFK